ncbi:MAG: SURF1 family cytochrome oxidase biogenesis protein, partial [Pseudomonadales bacterium]
TLGLGAWQLERAETKVELRDAYFERMAAEAVAPQAEPLMLERVPLVGRFEGTSFLVDNQVHQGRAGYWVVSSFLDESGSRYLVKAGAWAARRAYGDYHRHVAVAR